MVVNNNANKKISKGNWHGQFVYQADLIKMHNPIIDLLESLKQQLPLEQNYNAYIELATILNELYNNSVDHGVLELSSEIKQQSGGLYKFYHLRKVKLNNLTSGRVVFNFDYSADQNLLVIEIQDSGCGFDFEKYNSKPLMLHSISGKGLYIVSMLSDKVEYLLNGSKIRVFYTIIPAAEVGQRVSKNN